MIASEFSRRKANYIHRSIIIIAALIMAILGFGALISEQESSPKDTESEHFRSFRSIEDVPVGSDESNSPSVTGGDSDSTSSANSAAAIVQSSSFDEWFRVASEKQWFGSSMFGDQSRKRNKKTFLSKPDCAAAEDAGLVNISKDCVYECETCDIPNYRYRPACP